MNTARVIVLTIAIGAGGVAAYLASGIGNEPPPAAPAAEVDGVEVLIAKSDIGLGQSLSPDDLAWQVWPTSTASSNFIVKKDNPNASTEFVGSIARAPFIAGEPIREQKLVKANGSGFMAAILPTGMRAISTEISPETGAGGFILPNDRVDVIMSKRDRNPDRMGTAEVINSETILSNVRVLAIDQTVEDKNGQKVVVGKTATLELKPEQAETLARARQTGTLSLALRSIADANAQPQEYEGGKRDSVNVVRYGISTTATIQK
jgi:pilus assembly protein CpaB